MNLKFKRWLKGISEFILIIVTIGALVYIARVVIFKIAALLFLIFIPRIVG